MYILRKVKCFFSFEQYFYHIFLTKPPILMQLGGVFTKEYT